VTSGFETEGGTPPDDHLPPGIDPLGVPSRRTGDDTFVLLLAITVALLGLIFTLGWIVYHQLVAG
jgi:hypothetical protein